jgi:FKBP-type peptidyl-prolyl cis-trans isomerase FklB
MNRFTIILLITSIGLFYSCKNGTSENKNYQLKNKKDSVSYIIGHDYAEGIVEKGIEVNTKALSQGVEDAIKGESKFSDSIKQLIVNDFNAEMKAKEEKEKEIAALENKRKGEEFLAQIARKKSIKTSEYGLLYEVTKEGKGRSPKLGDSAVIHYQASFIDGTVFDDSYQWGPATLKVGEAIAGLNDGLQIMKPGGKYILYVSPELGYGNYNFANVVPPNSTLVYKIEYIKTIK